MRNTKATLVVDAQCRSCDHHSHHQIRTTLPVGGANKTVVSYRRYCQQQCKHPHNRVEPSKHCHGWHHLPPFFSLWLISENTFNRCSWLRELVYQRQNEAPESRVCEIG